MEVGEHEEEWQPESVQVQQQEGEDDMSVDKDNNNNNMTLIPEEEDEKNGRPKQQQHDESFENEERNLFEMEVVSREVLPSSQSPSSRRDENETNDAVKKDNDDDNFIPSPSPCKIARHEAPDLELSSEIKKEHFDPDLDPAVGEKEEITLNDKCGEENPQSDSASSPPCLNLSLPTPTPDTVSKEVENHYEEEDKVINDLDNKNGLDISSYTLMFPSPTRHHGSISTTPVSNNNGQVQNILVLNLPPGVNAVLSDQPPSETEENVLMTPAEMVDHQVLNQGVTNNISSPRSSSSSFSTSSFASPSTPQAGCDTTAKNLLNGVVGVVEHPDDNFSKEVRKCTPGIEPGSRVKFFSQVTPEGYVLNTPVGHSLGHHPSPKIPLNTSSFSSSSMSSSIPSLRNDDLGRIISNPPTNLEMENWQQKFREVHNKENSPTSILNGMQGFGPLANHFPVNSYILESNQMMSDPPQISHNPSMQTTHQICTLATSQPGSQISNASYPKHGQLTFCHNGLIPQPAMVKEEDRPCPLNYLQNMNPNYNSNISRKASSILCLKSNLANSKENDPTRHLHNLNERKRRARITIACDFMRRLVPGLSDKTDKATVFEYAARYIHFLNAQVGKEHDANFLVKYCNY